MNQQERLASAIAENPDAFLAILQRFDGDAKQPEAISEMADAYGIDIASADADAVVSLLVRQLRNPSGELDDSELQGVVGGFDIPGFLSNAWESFKNNVINNEGRREALDRIKWKVN